MIKNAHDTFRQYYASKNSENSGYIHAYNTYSMSDIYDVLNDIGINVFKNTHNAVGRPLWFRGQSYEKYNLIPSLYRERDNEKNDTGFYSSLSLAEEYRYQNFSARVNHLIGSNLEHRVEWQELLQHNLGKTRFMDWSESIETALNFALEPFIDTKDTLDNRIKRSTITPSIWVLNPYTLNSKVYDFFVNASLEFIEHAISNLYPNLIIPSVAREMQQSLKENKDIYFNFHDENDKVRDVSIAGLISMGVLDSYYHYNLEQMKNMLKHREFNPFFFLLIRYYTDALPVDAGINQTLLPPLASVQPYHSERIRAQRGTFTIFPNYCRTEEAKSFSGTKLDVISIEAQKGIANCFCNIRLCDPVRIARDLIYGGERRTEIYPDIEVYANYLETKQFFL